MNIKRAYRVWQRNFTVYTKLYKSSIALNFFEPILYLAALGLGLGAFVQHINGMPYIQFIAPGIIASSSMFATIYECTYGTYVRMTYQKTFDAILSTPVNLNDLIAGELMWGATKSMLYGSIIIFVISLFGLVDSPLILFAVPMLFITGIIFAEISEALSHAHTSGVIHRDIKPSNILLTEEGSPKITDFGLAKVGGGIQLTREQSTLGTAPYMSPEQIRGDDVDQRSDIWSWGVVFYEALCGQLPFDAASPATLVRALLHEEPLPPSQLAPGVPVALDRVALRALAKDPNDRYRDMQELIDDLETGL